MFKKSALLTTYESELLKEMGDGQIYTFCTN